MDLSESLQDFIKYHRRMLAFMSGVCLAVVVVILALRRGEFAWSGGFALGAAVQLFKFGVIDIATVKKLAVAETGASAIQLKASVVAFVLFGVSLVVLFRLELDIWAYAAGIFLPRLILIADTYLRPNPFAAPAVESTAAPTEDASDA